MTPKELVIEMIACNEIEIIEVRELRPLLYYDENEEYQKEITCKIDLSEFTYEEQQDILKIKELEFDGDYYYPVYIGLGKNIKNRKEVAWMEIFVLVDSIKVGEIIEVKSFLGSIKKI